MLLHRSGASSKPSFLYALDWMLITAGDMAKLAAGNHSNRCLLARCCAQQHLIGSASFSRSAQQAQLEAASCLKLLTSSAGIPCCKLWLHKPPMMHRQPHRNLGSHCWSHTSCLHAGGMTSGSLCISGDTAADAAWAMLAVHLIREMRFTGRGGTQCASQPGIQK